MKKAFFSCILGLLFMGAPIQAQMFHVPAPQAMESFSNIWKAYKHGSATCSVPGTISDLAEVSHTSTTVTVSFTTPSGSPTSYQWSNDGTNYASGPSSGVVTGLTASTTYSTFRIRAVNSCGNGAASNQISFTTSGGSYPTGVTTAGLEAVYDLRPGGANPAGPTSSTTSTLGVTSLSGFCNASFAGSILSISSGTCTFNRWDMTAAGAGAEIQIDGTANVTFVDSTFKMKSGRNGIILTAINSGNPTVTCTRCSFDYAGIDSAASFESLIYLKGSGSKTFSYSTFKNAFNDYITRIDTGNLTVDHSYFQAPCFNVPGTGPHCELVHDQGTTATTLWDSNYIDMSDFNGLGNIWSSYLRPEGPASGGGSFTLTWTVQHSIFNGMANIPGGHFYAFQVASTSTSAVSSITFNNNVMDSGTSGYLLNNNSARITITCGTGANLNVDYSTGNSIGTCPP